MANNIKDFRVAFLLTPRQLAERLGIDVRELNRLEKTGANIPPEWAEAVAMALNIPVSAVKDRDVDIKAIAADISVTPKQHNGVCRIGARFAIQAMVAKLGGLQMALELSESDLAFAIQSVSAYAEETGIAAGGEKQINRLSQSLQIAALTILQSRGADPRPELHRSMEIAREGALSLLQSFSRIDQMRRDQGTE